MAYLLSLLCLTLLFLPKINILSIGGRETAGVRLDDLVLFAFSLLFFWGSALVKRRWEPIEKTVIAIVGFALVSFYCNRFLVSIGFLHVDASIFYAVRLFEYFIFFYVGMLATPYFRASSILKAFLLWNLVIILLQMVGIVGAFTVHGYLPVVKSRFQGIASFPSEMGLLLCMIYSFLVFDRSTTFSSWWKLLPSEMSRILKESYIYWLLVLVGALAVVTGSRIALLALALTFLFRVKQEISLRTPAKLFTAAVLVALGVSLFSYMITATMSIYQRSAGLLAFNNIELIQTVWEQIDTHYDPIGKEIVARGSGSDALYDASWWMRIHKWGYALKIYVQHPECWIQGVGPGFAMAGLDGGFLRILTEYGIIGCLLFWRLFSQLWRQSPALKWVVIAILVNMIFFDVYLAYKPMAFLFLLAGLQPRQGNASLSTAH